MRTGNWLFLSRMKKRRVRLSLFPWRRHAQSLAAHAAHSPNRVAAPISIKCHETPIKLQTDSHGRATPIPCRARLSASGLPVQPVPTRGLDISDSHPEPGPRSPVAHPSIPYAHTAIHLRTRPHPKEHSVAFGTSPLYPTGSPVSQRGPAVVVQRILPFHNILTKRGVACNFE